MLSPKTPTYDVFYCDFGFDSHDWSCSKNRSGAPAYGKFACDFDLPGFALNLLGNQGDGCDAAAAVTVLRLHVYATLSGLVSCYPDGSIYAANESFLLLLLGYTEARRAVSSLIL